MLSALVDLGAHVATPIPVTLELSRTQASVSTQTMMILLPGGPRLGISERPRQCMSTALLDSEAREASSWAKAVVGAGDDEPEEFAEDEEGLAVKEEIFKLI